MHEVLVDTTQGIEKRMTLKEIEACLSDGDIILSSNKISPVAFLIRLFTRSRYSHADLYSSHNEEAIGARFSGIKKVPLLKYSSKHTYILILRPESNSEAGTKVIKYAESLTNRGYDFLHIFMYAWRILVGRLGKSEMPDDPQKHICFEFVAFCWKKLGVQLGGKFEDNVTGRSLVQDNQLTPIL